MNDPTLIATAKELVADDKGILAMDESNPTCNKRFAKLGIPQTAEAHRGYRQMIVTTARLGESISGAILYDETMRQKTSDGTPLVDVLTDAGIIVGIKVDTGAKEMAGHPGEKITVRNVFMQLNCQRVLLEGILLKSNMVVPGLTCPQQATAEQVAEATVRCLLRTVPAAVPGIAFLSGGQSAELASVRLNAMNAGFKSRVPWALSFSYGRALQQPALEIWRGEESNVPAAQQALLRRARCNHAARRGEYTPAMESGAS